MKKTVLLGVLGLIVFYILGAVVTFDFSHNAYPLNEKYYPNGRIEVLGPIPRGALCSPVLGDVHYKGSEWPFLLYRPLCQFWKSKEEGLPLANPSVTSNANSAAAPSNLTTRKVN